MWVHGGDGGNDVVFCGFYCWLGCVGSVVVGFCNLEWYLLGSNTPLDGVGSLFVEDVQGCCVALLFEFGVCALESDDHTFVLL